MNRITSALVNLGFLIGVSIGASGAAMAQDDEYCLAQARDLKREATRFFDGRVPDESGVVAAGELVKTCVNQLLRSVRPDVPLVVRNAPKQQFFYTSGLNLANANPNAIAAGLWTSTVWGYWGLHVVETNVRVTKPEFTLKMNCDLDEVATGWVGSQQLQCSKLKNGYAVINITQHPLAWNFNINVPCPGTKVLVGWNGATAASAIRCGDLMGPVTREQVR